MNIKYYAIPNIARVSSALVWECLSKTNRERKDTYAFCTLAHCNRFVCPCLFVCENNSLQHTAAWPHVATGWQEEMRAIWQQCLLPVYVSLIQKARAYSWVLPSGHEWDTTYHFPFTITASTSSDHSCWEGKKTPETIKIGLEISRLYEVSLVCWF